MIEPAPDYPTAIAEAVAALQHDLEPLLINVAGSWPLRPNAFTRIPTTFFRPPTMCRSTRTWRPWREPPKRRVGP